MSLDGRSPEEHNRILRKSLSPYHQKLEQKMALDDLS